MATEWVTQNRTGAEPLETGTGTIRDRFRTGPNRGTVKPPGKKVHEPDLRTVGWNRNRSNGSMEPEAKPGPVRVNRPNDSMEPEWGPVRVNRPSGSMEPEP